MNKKLALFATLGLCTACVGSAFAISNMAKSISKANVEEYSITFDKDSRYETNGRFHSQSTNGTDFVLYCVNCNGNQDGYITTLLSTGSGFDVVNEFQNVTSIVVDFEGTDGLDIFFDDANDGEYDNTRRSTATSGVECTPSDASYGEGCIIRCWVKGSAVKINSITINYTCE